jgi:hypothetical protein
MCRPPARETYISPWRMSTTAGGRSKPGDFGFGGKESRWTES